MRSRFRGGVLLIAVIAMLAFASTALAKGSDGGGGGATCASITSFSNTPGFLLDSASVTTSYSVYNGCVDERMSSIALDIHNDDTGFTGRSVTMAKYGTNDYSNTWPSTYGTRYTITLTVYAPNGKVAATQTQRVTAPDAPATTG